MTQTLGSRNCSGSSVEIEVFESKSGEYRIFERAWQ